MSMSPSYTVQVDDFDPLIVYSDPGQWTTPNPQDNPSWFNETKEQTGSVWHQATYHVTSQPTDFYLNFTGTSVRVLGVKGPDCGQYSVQLDSADAETRSGCGAAENSTEPLVLYEKSDLTLGRHSMKVANLNGTLLVDRIEFVVPVGGEGATLSNTTLDESDSRITYSAGWQSNSVALFYGGTSIYASEPGAEMSFNFSGSALYIYGDQVNDHGDYSVYYNDSQTPVQTLNGRSGCGGDVGKSCEKLGGLHFFDAPLPAGTHRVRLVNGGSADAKTFVDIDKIVFTTPTVYTQLAGSNTTSPSSSSSASASAPASVSGSGAAASASPSGGAIRTEAFGGLLLLGFWAVKMLGF